MKKTLSLLFMLNTMLQLTAQNVGIGTTTPTEKLQVADGNIGILNTTDAKNWRLSYVQSQDRFSIQEDGSSRLSIANGGSVGIGTTIPNTKAILDIGSTTKGVLFPRMTTSQRLAIATPPNGLMVYDTDKNELNQYDGTAWRAILNNNYWTRPITSRNRITNPNDSIGIGTNSPTEWLDVDGNIRSRNNLIVDNGITATGSILGGAVTSTGNVLALGNGTFNGNLTSNSDLSVAGTSLITGNSTINSNLSVAGTSLLAGDVTTNSILTINNTAATLQLKSNNVFKALFQLSGNDLRMGTSFGNTTGNLVIRMNGNDRVQINASGDIDLDGKITRNAATGTASLTPYCYGFIRGNGSIETGTGNFTVQRVQTGIYYITCPGLTLTNSIVFANSRFRSHFVNGSPQNGVIQLGATDLYDVQIDTDFYFIVYKP